MCQELFCVFTSLRHVHPFLSEQAREIGRRPSKSKKICRKTRDIRLHKYKPLTLAAFLALSDIEAFVVLPRDLQYKYDNIEFYERRVRATKGMRRNEHFLGGLTNIGQAYDSNSHAHQCCYVCQGMMGYTTQATFDPKSVRSYMC